MKSPGFYPESEIELWNGNRIESKVGDWTWEATEINRSKQEDPAHTTISVRYSGPDRQRLMVDVNLPNSPTREITAVISQVASIGLGLMLNQEHNDQSNKMLSIRQQDLLLFF